jgi:hypothetical protein
MPETEPQQTEHKRRGRPPGSRNKSTALTKTHYFKKREPAKRGMPQPSHIDLNRWYLHEYQGKSVDDIAKIQGKRPFEVQASLDYISEWKFRNQVALLDAKLVSVVMHEMDGMGKVLADGMKAEKVVHVNHDTGKIRRRRTTP